MNLFANAASLVNTMAVSATKISSIYNDFADQHFVLICCAAAAIGAILYFSVTGVGANLKRIRAGRSKLREGGRTTVDSEGKRMVGQKAHTVGPA